MHTRVLIAKDDKAPAFEIEDRIFLGEGLFETLKVESSKPRSVYLHWQRLGNSAQQLGIPFDLSFNDWQNHLIAQIKRDNLYHGGIKAILSGGSAPRGLAERGNFSQLAFQTFNYSIHSHPLRLKSASWLRDGANPIYQLKTVNYLEAILGRRYALTLGVDDVLFFNMQYYATETTCANLFLIKNNELLTPFLANGVLPGITRLKVLSLCKQHHISCIEADLTKEMIAEADGIFVTNSLQGIQCVRALDDVTFDVNHALVEQLISLLSMDELNDTKN